MRESKVIKGKLSHCLHGHKAPVFSVTPGVETTWVVPKIRYTMAMVETDTEYRFGISILFNKEDIYSRKFGHAISEGRAYKRPFLVIDKSKFSKEQATDLLYQAGYKFIGASKRTLKSWKDADFDTQNASKIFSFAFDGNAVKFEDIDLRKQTEEYKATNKNKF